MDGLNDAPPLGRAAFPHVSQAGDRLKPVRSAAEIARYHDALVRHGVQLMALHTGEVATLIRRIIDSIANSTPKILVVGHRGAGKTTLVNTLIGRPGFLPARAKGATSAVTRLHFALPSGPVRGAVAATGGVVPAPRHATQREPGNSLVARIRQMGTIDDAGPGVAPRSDGRREWRDAVAEMGMIASYIHRDEEPSGESAGTIDIYFDASPLGCPLQIVDTPPLHASRKFGGLSEGLIDDADACIVVIDGSSPESALAPALLDIAYRIPIERLVVFLNQRRGSDARSASDARVAAVRRLLRQRLQQDVPVLAADLGGPVEASTPLFGAVLKDLPLSSQLSRPAGEGARPLLPTPLKSAAELGELVDALVHRTTSGPYVRRLMEVASTLWDVAQVREEAARAGAVAICNRILDIHKERREKEAEIERIERLIGEIRILSEGIERSVEKASAAVKTVQDEGARLVRQMLESLFNRFLSEQSKSLEAAVGDKSLASWRCDTSQWRREFEDESARLLRHLRLKLFDALRAAVEDFRSGISEALPDLKHDLLLTRPSPNFYLPSLELPVRPIVFSFETGGWLRRFKSRPSATAVVDDLKRHLIEEFDDAAKATVEQMTQGLAKDAAVILFRLSQKSIAVIDMMVERREQLAMQARALLSDHHSGDVERVLATHALEQAEAERFVTAAAQVSEILREMVTTGAALMERREAQAWH